MKSKIVNKGVLLLAALVLGSVSVFAAGKGKIAVAPYLKTTYAVISAEPAVDALYSISIFDPWGQVVYSSNKVDNGVIFSKLFDFSKLEDGQYTVRLKSKGNSVIEEHFVIKSGVLLNEEDSSDVSATDVKIWKDSEFVFISHLNRNLNDMVVRLVDERGSVIYDKSLPAELAYSGKFNVSTLPKGNYSLNFHSGNTSFNYEFAK